MIGKIIVSVFMAVSSGWLMGHKGVGFDTACIVAMIVYFGSYTTLMLNEHMRYVEGIENIEGRK